MLRSVLSSLGIPFSKQALVRIDEVGSTLVYLGLARTARAGEADSVWKIGRLTKVGTETELRWALGGSSQLRWDLRASYFPSFPPPPPPFIPNALSTQFNGINSRIHFGDNYGFERSLAFSVSMWIRPQNLGAFRCLMGKTSNDSAVVGWRVFHDTAGRIQIQIRTTTSALGFQVSDQTIPALSWSHVLLTYDGSSSLANGGLRLYINGIQDTFTPTGNLSGTMVNGDALHVGSSNSTFYYVGEIDEVSVWDKELSLAEAGAVYNGGAPTDLVQHSAAVNLLSWWRMGDGDTAPVVTDNHGAVNGTMVNMTSASFVEQVP